MARIRSVHPGLWTDENFVGMSNRAQLLFIAVLTETDDGGVFQWKPVQIKIRLRPASTDSPQDIEGFLLEMVRSTMVAAYDIEGVRYGVVRNFGDWQSPRHPSFTHPASREMREYAKVSKKSGALDGLTGAIPVNFGNDPPSTPPVTAICGNDPPLTHPIPAGEERRGEEKNLSQPQPVEKSSPRDPGSTEPLDVVGFCDEIEQIAGADSTKNPTWATSLIPTVRVWLDKAEALGIGPVRAQEVIRLKVREVRSQNPNMTISRPAYFNRAINEALDAETTRRAENGGFKPGRYGSPPPEVLKALEQTRRDEEAQT